MKKEVISLILPIMGAFSVLIFGANAAASIADAQLILPSAYAEPLNMILVGVSFLGFGKIMRIKAGKQKDPISTTQRRLTKRLTGHQVN